MYPELPRQRSSDRQLIEEICSRIRLPHCCESLARVPNGTWLKANAGVRTSDSINLIDNLEISGYIMTSDCHYRS